MRMFRANSRPSISGNLASSRASVGRLSRAAWRAVWPSSARMHCAPSPPSTCSRDQHMSGSSSTTRTTRFTRLTALLLCRGQRRQFHREGTPLSALALHTDRAAVLIDDGVADREPKACTLSKRSSCEEGIEDLVEVFLRDPFSGISDAKQHLAGGLLSEDVDRPAVRHGVHGVEQQIDEHLFQEAGNAENLAGLRREVRANFDILNLGLVIYKSQSLFHSTQEVQRRRALISRGMRKT